MSQKQLDELLKTAAEEPWLFTVRRRFSFTSQLLADELRAPGLKFNLFGTEYRLFKGKKFEGWGLWRFLHDLIREIFCRIFLLQPRTCRYKHKYTRHDKDEELESFSSLAKTPNHASPLPLPSGPRGDWQILDNDSDTPRNRTSLESEPEGVSCLGARNERKWSDRVTQRLVKRQLVLFVSCLFSGRPVSYFPKLKDDRELLTVKALSSMVAVAFDGLKESAVDESDLAGLKLTGIIRKVEEAVIDVLHDEMKSAAGSLRMAEKQAVSILDGAQAAKNHDLAPTWTQEVVCTKLLLVCSYVLDAGDQANRTKSCINALEGLISSTKCQTALGCMVGEGLKMRLMRMWMQQGWGTGERIEKVIVDVRDMSDLVATVVGCKPSLRVFDSNHKDITFASYKSTWRTNLRLPGASSQHSKRTSLPHSPSCKPISSLDTSREPAHSSPDHKPWRTPFASASLFCKALSSGCWGCHTEMRGLRVYSSKMRGHKDEVLGLAVDSVRQRLFSVSEDNDLRVWVLGDIECLQQIPLPEPKADVLRMTNDMDSLFVSMARDLCVFDLDTLQLKFRMNCHWADIRALAVCQETGMLFTGGHEGNIKIWDTKMLSSDGKGFACRGDLEGHADTIMSIAVSQDGKKLFSGDMEGEIIVWDLDSQSEVGRLDGHADWVVSLAYDEAEQILISGCLDCSMRVWDVPHMKCLHTVKVHTRHVNALDIDKDRRIVFSGSADGSVRIWNLKELKEKGKGEMHCLIHSKGCGILLSAGHLYSSGPGRTIHLWDV